ncbi:MAG: dockerin type I domain-containing protein [Pirellulaceae bacterium]|nr:dockerin type I domain-containing protein [Pirellulaceae bacterium]
MGHMRQDTMGYDTEWNPWHNAANPYDVDGRNGAEPLDALLIINYLNAANSRWPEPPTSPTVPPRYYDVSGGSARAYIEPLDVLKVINYLNGGSATAGEGEGAAASVSLFFPQLAVTTPASAPAFNANWAERTTDYPQPTQEPASQAYDQPASNPATASPAAGWLPMQSTSLLTADKVWADGSTSALDDEAWWEEPGLLSAFADDVDHVWQLG